MIYYNILFSILYYNILYMPAARLRQPPSCPTAARLVVCRAFAFRSGRQQPTDG